LLKVLRRSRSGIQYVEHTEGDGAKMFKAVCKLGPRGHRLKEAQCAISVGTIEGMAENQKPKSARSDTRHRWDILVI
jgi:hypothetical protein